MRGVVGRLSAEVFMDYAALNRQMTFSDLAAAIRANMPARLYPRGAVAARLRAAAAAAPSCDLRADAIREPLARSFRAVSIATMPKSLKPPTTPKHPAAPKRPAAPSFLDLYAVQH